MGSAGAAGVPDGATAGGPAAATDGPTGGSTRPGSPARAAACGSISLTGPTRPWSPGLPAHLGQQVDALGVHDERRDEVTALESAGSDESYDAVDLGALVRRATDDVLVAVVEGASSTSTSTVVPDAVLGALAAQLVRRAS